jgi:Ca2+/Na+ antiporter
MCDLCHCANLFGCHARIRSPAAFTVSITYLLLRIFPRQFCTKYKIPDDVAGATFMAAAASSPEMFAAFISLFITHSALGVGTIIGSELFNHLMITAGSIYYSKGGNIQCDWRLVGRESFFYLLAMALLVNYIPLRGGWLEKSRLVLR